MPIVIYIAYGKHAEGGGLVKYICDICGWQYDEEVGSLEASIAPGTKLEELPDDFTCPICGASKNFICKAE